MLESLLSVFIETINLIIGVRTHVKKGGCKDLYALYLSLDKVLEASVGVQKRIKEVLDKGGRDEDINHSYYFQNLMFYTHEFTFKLSLLRDTIKIFDKSLKDDLVNFLGWKHTLIWWICSYSELVDDKDRNKFLRYIDLDLKKIREMACDGVDIDLVLLSKEGEKRMSMAKQMGVGNEEYISLDNKTRITEVLWNIDKNIKQMRISLDRLGAFIRENCKYEQMF